MNKKIIDRAKSMANDKTPNGGGRFWYSIHSNPYRHTNGRGLHGKSHIEWHNAFYDECKRVGRSIY